MYVDWNAETAAKEMVCRLQLLRSRTQYEQLVRAVVCLVPGLWATFNPVHVYHWFFVIQHLYRLAVCNIRIFFMKKRLLLDIVLFEHRSVLKHIKKYFKILFTKKKNDELIKFGE
jgi:hypothetical protein